MDEYQIECRVEKMVDALDRRYMSDNNTMTEEEYKYELRLIDRWSANQYRAIRPAPFKEDFRNYS